MQQCRVRPGGIQCSGDVWSEIEGAGGAALQATEGIGPTKVCKKGGM